MAFQLDVILYEADDANVEKFFFRSLYNVEISIRLCRVKQR